MKKEKAENILKKLFSLLMLLIVIIVTCFPFLMMFMGSFKEDYEIFSLSPKIPSAAGFQLKMYRMLFANWPFVTNMMNSVIVAVSTTALACFSAQQQDLPLQSISSRLKMCFLSLRCHL